jgi:hypothetical protein
MENETLKTKADKIEITMSFSAVFAKCRPIRDRHGKGKFSKRSACNLNVFSVKI